MKDKDLGIYSVNSKKFYYLESGDVHIANPIPRLRGVLHQRDLIDFSPQNYMDTSNYLIRTVREAKKNEWEMERIFASTFLRELFEKQESEQQAKNAKPDASRSWGQTKSAPKVKATRTRKAAAKSKKTTVK